MKLTKQMIEARTFWADQLESGDWEQAQSYLCSPTGFCCLGVAAACGLTEPKRTWEDEQVNPFAGFCDAHLRDFIRLNDGKGASFEEIAEVVRFSILPDYKDLSPLAIWTILRIQNDPDFRVDGLNMRVRLEIREKYGPAKYWNLAYTWEEGYTGTLELANSD